MGVFFFFFFFFSRTSRTTATVATAAAAAAVHLGRTSFLLFVYIRELISDCCSSSSSSSSYPTKNPISRRVKRHRRSNKTYRPCSYAAKVMWWTRTGSVYVHHIEIELPGVLASNARLRRYTNGSVVVVGSS